jgi:hypothetical protein
MYDGDFADGGRWAGYSALRASQVGILSAGYRITTRSSAAIGHVAHAKTGSATQSHTDWDGHPSGPFVGRGDADPGWVSSSGHGGKINPGGRAV